MNHTPIPWKAQPTRGRQVAIDRKWEIVAPIEGGEAVVVGEHTGVDCFTEANAEHICRCVNMHEELVYLLADCREFILRFDEQDDEELDMSRRISATLDKLA